MDFILKFNLADLLTWEILFAIVFGVLFGIVVGAIPGLGATIGLALVLPITFNMTSLGSIVLLASVFMGCEYGGSVSAILMGIPGTGAATATILDGYPMAKQGRPGTALGYSLVGALIGGVISVLALMILSKPIASLALKFSDPEFFILGIIGLLAVAGLSSKDIFKSVISVCIGLLMSMVGIDILTGQTRFTFGTVHLMDGLHLVALFVGMFAVSEVFAMLGNDPHTKYVHDKKNFKVAISWKEFTAVKWTYLKGSIIGTIIGILPGVGSSAASWLAYTEAKSTAKNKENFGKGDPRGIAAPETANNAVVGGALIPLVTLGIPGSAATAVILGAFLIHGIVPGPASFANQPGLMYGIFWGLLFATIIMYFLGRYTTSLMARILVLPLYVLTPIVLYISLIGVFASELNVFHLWVAIIAGIAAFFLKNLDFSLPSMVLAYILGPIIEESLRRTLVISKGSVGIFFTRPASIALMALIVIFIAVIAYQRIKAAKKPVQKDLHSSNI